MKLKHFILLSIICCSQSVFGLRQLHRHAQRNKGILPRVKRHGLCAVQVDPVALGRLLQPGQIIGKIVDFDNGHELPPTAARPRGRRLRFSGLRARRSAADWTSRGSAGSDF